MTFTDDDLKRLKKWIQTDISETQCVAIEALLARLEAAEECAKNLENLHAGMNCITAWRNAAGKP